MIGDIERRWAAEGPRRLLIVSAPGVDGALLGAGALEALETMLRARDPNVDDFRLSTYFDLVVGAGLGAALGLQLALGARAVEAGRAVRALADARPAALDGAARAIVGDRALGELDWRTAFAATLGRLDQVGRLLSTSSRWSRWDDAGDAPGQRHWLARRFIAAAIGGPLAKPLEIALDGKADRGLFVDPAATPEGDPAVAAARMIAGQRLPGAVDPRAGLLCVHLVVTPSLPDSATTLKRARSGKGARGAVALALADAGVEAGFGALDAIAPSAVGRGGASPRIELVRVIVERHGAALAAHTGAAVPKKIADAWDKGEDAPDRAALIALGRAAGEASFSPRQFPHAFDPVGFVAPVRAAG